MVTWEWFVPQSGCWQLKYCLFSPRKLGKMRPFWRSYFWNGLKPPTRPNLYFPTIFSVLVLSSEQNVFQVVLLIVQKSTKPPLYLWYQTLITVIEQFKGRFSPFRFLNELDKMGGRFIGMWIDPVFSCKFPPLKIREDEAILKKQFLCFPVNACGRSSHSHSSKRILNI